MNQLDFLTSKIVAKRAERSAEQAVLVGISGIDAGGKGFITEKIAKRLQELGWRVATIKAEAHSQFCRGLCGRKGEQAQPPLRVPQDRHCPAGGNFPFETRISGTL